MPSFWVEFVMRVVIWLFKYAVLLLLGLALGLLAAYPFAPNLVAWPSPLIGWATAGLCLIYGVAA